MHPKSRHPLWSDRVVHPAMNLLIDRESLQAYVFGGAGTAGATWINHSPRCRSPAVPMEFNGEKARQLLDAAG